jgi:hypothetical protein
MPYFAAMLGITLAAVLAGCGGSSPSPSSTAVPSVNLSASDGISPAQACDAAKGALSAFNSAYPAAADDTSKAQAAAQYEDTFAAIALALSENALISPTNALADATLEKDADTTGSDAGPIVGDLLKGNAKAADALIPGRFTTDYKDFETAACGTAS